MNYIVTNVYSILIATFVGLAFSFVYAKVMPQTGAHRGLGMVGLFVTAAVAEFWLTSILAGALILAPVQAGAWTIAIGSAVVIWIGFVLPILVVTELFRDVPVARMISDCIHWLGVMLVQAAALQVVGLVRPN